MMSSDIAHWRLPTLLNYWFLPFEATSTIASILGLKGQSETKHSQKRAYASTGFRMQIIGRPMIARQISQQIPLQSKLLNGITNLGLSMVGKDLHDPCQALHARPFPVHVKAARTCTGSLRTMAMCVRCSPSGVLHAAKTCSLTAMTVAKEGAREQDGKNLGFKRRQLVLWSSIGCLFAPCSRCREQLGYIEQVKRVISIGWSRRLWAFVGASTESG